MEVYMSRKSKMLRHKILLLIDEDLYYALKELPRTISISDIVNILLKLFLGELQASCKMTEKELEKWIRKDSQQTKIRTYLREKFLPYIDKMDAVMNKYRAVKGLIDEP